MSMFPEAFRPVAPDSLGVRPDTALNVRADLFPRASDAVMGFGVGLGLGEWLVRAEREPAPAALEGVPGDLGLALFTLDGLIRAHVRRRMTGDVEPDREIDKAAQRLLRWQERVAAGGTPEHDDGGFLDDCLRKLLIPAGSTAPDQSRSGFLGKPGEAACLLVAPIVALWSPAVGVVRDLAVRIIGQFNREPLDQASAAALTVFTNRLLAGSNQLRALDAAQSVVGELPAAAPVVGMINQVHESIVARGGNVPLSEVSSFGPPSSAFGMLARIFASSFVERDFVAVLRRIAQDCGGSSVAGAVHAGLVGLVSAGGRLPDEQLAEAPLAQLLGVLTRDATREFGPEPPESEEWLKRYPVAPDAQGATAQPCAGGDAPARAPEQRARATVLGRGSDRDERRNRVLGAVLGFAIGDRLGSGASGMSWPEIRQQFGAQGITRYAPLAEAEQLRSRLVRLGLSLDTVIRADRARLMGAKLDLGQAIAEAYRQAAARIPEFANDVIAESAALYPLDPQVGPSLTQVDVGAEEIIKYLPLALWTEVPSRLFALVRQAASVSASAEDAVSIAAYAVVLQVCIVSKNPDRAVGTAMAELKKLGNTEAGAALARAEQLARKGISPEEIEQLGSGETAAEAIAIAVCALQSEPYSVDDALRVAVNHSGNSAITGALCGALLGGSYEGAQRIPEHWLQGLTGGHMLYRLAQDACEQFGPEPRVDAEWQRRYPILPVGGSGNDDPGTLADQQRFAVEPGAALTGKVAELLTLDEQVVLETRGRSDTRTDYEWRNGERVMRYWDAQRVRRVFGRSSDEFCQELRYDKTIKDASLFYGIGMHFPFAALESALADMVVHGRLSSSTQMTLFCLDAVVRTETWLRQTKRLIPRTISLLGLLRWLHTQGVPWDRVVTAGIFEEVPEPTGWLIKVPELFERRDPDPVCIEALSAFAERDVTGWFSKPINRARTPSAVPRAIALSAWSDIPERVFEQAVANALLTHGHPDAYLSAGAYAVLVNTVLSGGTLEDGIQVVADELAKWPDENVRRLLDSCELTGPPPSPSELSALVEDGAAPNALAVAVVAAARDNDFESAVRRAAEVLPAAAPLVGGFHGARNGEQGLPREWLGRLELRDVVDRLVFDVAAVQVGLPERVWTPDWAGPYPGF